MTDLYLAPVLIEVEAQIETYGAFGPEELARRVAMASDLPDDTSALRAQALLKALTHLIDLHDWTLSWDPRGVRVAHGDHALVLGIPATFRSYIVGD
jgi:hypothetical protein